MEYFLCQSCGSHFPIESFHGTNADGSKNEDYCKFCWVDGAFGNPNETIEEMVESCVPFMVKSEKNPNGYPDEQTARKMLQEQLPKLKRWQTA